MSAKIDKPSTLPVGVSRRKYFWRSFWSLETLSRIVALSAPPVQTYSSLDLCKFLFQRATCRRAIADNLVKRWVLSVNVIAYPVVWLIKQNTSCSTDWYRGARINDFGQKEPHKFGEKFSALVLSRIASFSPLFITEKYLRTNIL